MKPATAATRGFQLRPLTPTQVASRLAAVRDPLLTIYRWLYQLLLALAYPIAWLRPRLRARREPAYGQRIPERFGHLPEAIPTQVIWCHAVSAGEVIAAAPLLAQLAERFRERRFLVTTTTPTGAAQVEQLLMARFANVSHCYAPYDFRHVQKRFFDRVQPALLILIETELWPNQLELAAARAIPACLINGRLSERSAERYRLISPLADKMLSNLRLVACQSDAHHQRFVELGADPEHTVACGSLKFDAQLPADHAHQVLALRSTWQLDSRFVWIAASTHEGEEAPLLAAHAQLLNDDPDALLILVPRHPVRCDTVAALIEKQDLRLARLTDESAARSDIQVLLVDTMGQLQSLYGVSDVAFIGGSLVAIGGHNPIEAALCGIPMLMGSQDFNFSEVVAEFRAAGVLMQVSPQTELANELNRLRKDPGLREKRGDAGRRVVADNAGALAFCAERLSAEINQLAMSPAIDPSMR